MKAKADTADALFTALEKIRRFADLARQSHPTFGAIEWLATTAMNDARVPLGREIRKVSGL